MNVDPGDVLAQQFIDGMLAVPGTASQGDLVDASGLRRAARNRGGLLEFLWFRLSGRHNIIPSSWAR